MKKKVYPKYSVLMSVYFKENPKWFDESISSMLNQTVLCDEFVIVEDGQLTDELEKIVLKYEKKYPNIFKIIRLKKNQGLGLALKRGIEECSNEYIARMDSDDYSVPNRCELELNKMESNPKLGIVGSIIFEFEDNIENIISKRILPEQNEEIYKYAKKRNPFGHPSVMLRKSMVLDAGNYRDYYLCEDYDMWVRMFENNVECYNFQEPLTYMRISKDFYARRGGIKYLKSILKFKNELKKRGFYSLKDYVISAGSHTVVCLMPNFLRDWIYRKMLRKN